MSRQLITTTAQRNALQELIACDPRGLETASVPIQLGQGTLEAGAFITSDGQRATIATQVEGVLATWLDTANYAVIVPYTDANGRSQFIQTEDFFGQRSERSTRVWFPMILRSLL